MKSLILCLLIGSMDLVLADTVKEDLFSPHKDLVEVPEDKSSQPKNYTTWTQFKTDDCLIYNKSNLNEQIMRDNGFRRCRDNSISYVQPKARGAGGWEGKCGQTFGANSLSTICATSVDPNTYFNGYFSDITPGVRPGTLRSGLSRVFKKNQEDCPQDGGRWVYVKLGGKSNYIKRLKQYIIPNYSHSNLISIQRDGKEYLRNPVAALIQNPGGSYLHWVSIIDVIEKNNQCHFVVNHWDNQYELPCELLAKWSGRVGKTYPIILKSYSVVVFK